MNKGEIIFEDTLLEITPELMKKTIIKQSEEIERLNKSLLDIKEYLENDMPYLEEPDDDYENNHKMREFDKSKLLDIVNKAIGEDNGR